MFKAIDIANYIINKCIDLGRPITNLQLQKILYYVQGEFIKQTGGKELFYNEISAWQYGPVVPDVYFEFNTYSASDLNTKIDTSELPKAIKRIIDPVIEEKSLLSAWKLVEYTHREKPWLESYVEGQKNIIDLEKMRRHFLSKQVN
ncbi:MAG: DUF4065 domain-containing protein [Paeniclostridium sordellii]|nr:DUF4065 domain-containing protein [Paeniclostridium sordellii]